MKRKGRGGRRTGAGRKRGTKVQHLERQELDGETPVHVTLRLLPALAGLRRREPYLAVRQALILAAHRDDFRICQFSIQRNHIHLICEAASKDALSSGMIAFKTSCARRLNAVAGRAGKVFADRYHVRYLTSFVLVRRALSYVLNNWRRHGEDRAHPTWLTDPYSSADFFDGWRDHVAERPSWLGPEETPPVADARFRALTTAWRAHGTIVPREVPDPNS